MTEEEKKVYMTRALELAKCGRGHTNPNPMVGAVIVRDGRILGEGYHAHCGEGHAEVNAFANCSEDPAGAEMFVTLEPCSHYGKTPPCADLIIKKKIKKVYVASLDPNPLVAGRGVKKLEEAGIAVETGIMEKESNRLNEIFRKYIVEKQPFVLLKSAMTLDGKIATVTGESKWISNEASRQHSQELRNQYMGILVGIGTVLADDPQLTCRLPGGRQPVRIVVDSKLRIPEEATVLTEQDTAKTVLAIAKATDFEKLSRIETRGITVYVCPDETEEKVDFRKLFSLLGKEGMDSILVEGGAQISGAILKERLPDRVLTYIAPKLVGGAKAKTPIEGEGIASLAEALTLEDLEVIPLDGDVALTGRVVK